MKKKIAGWVFSVLYSALMIFSLIVPNSVVPTLVTALTWVACLLVWVVLFLCLAGWYAGGVHREEVKQSLMGFFCTSGSPVFKWATRSLIVIFLAFTGHVITLIFYLMTMVAIKVIRSQVTEPVAV